MNCFVALNESHFSILLFFGNIVWLLIWLTLSALLKSKLLRCYQYYCARFRMSLDLQASEGQAESSTSIADSLKAAAEEVVWKEAGFIYDSASGLYYNYDSGYYYDSVGAFR